MKKNFLFISCEEAKHICDKRQYDEASAWERIKLGLRLLWCRVTRSYSSRNNKLTQAMEKAKVNCLNTTEKQNLQNTLNQELAKHQ